MHKLIVLAIAVTFMVSMHSYGQKKMNVVVILADDLGYGDVHCFNPERGKIPTPNMDKLAAEGMRFTDAHSSSSICTPSRYSLLTGRYHWRTRLQSGIINPWEAPLISPGRLTIAGLAKKTGYETAAIGKWHLGWNWSIDSMDLQHFTRYGPPEGVGDTVKEYIATPQDVEAWKKTFSQPITGGPTAVGFDYYFGTDVPNWPPFCFIENDKTVGIPSRFLAPGQVRKNQASKQGPAMPDWKFAEVLPTVFDKAVRFIDDKANESHPFLLYLALTAPHTPIAVEQNWKNQSGLENEYADFVMETDAAVGKILEALEKNHLADNTLVIFTSDNGCSENVGVKELAQRGHYVSGVFRGYKHDFWEGGHRMPFIVRMPGITKPGSVCDQMVCQTDIMATLADLFKIKLPTNAGEDSYSLMALLKGGKEGRKNLVSCSGDGVQTVRMGPWKLICTSKPQLYNLAEDLSEKEDVAKENPEIVKEILKIRENLIFTGRSTNGPPQKNDVEVK
jgi:arylsulfatase A-like enzyme